MNQKKTNAKPSIADTLKGKIQEQVAKAAGFDLKDLQPMLEGAKAGLEIAKESMEETFLQGCEMIARASFAARFVHQTNSGIIFDRTNFEDAYAALMGDEPEETDPENPA